MSTSLQVTSSCSQAIDTLLKKFQHVSQNRESAGCQARSSHAHNTKLPRGYAADVLYRNGCFFLRENPRLIERSDIRRGLKLLQNIGRNQVTNIDGHAVNHDKRRDSAAAQRLGELREGPETKKHVWCTASSCRNQSLKSSRRS